MRRIILGVLVTVIGVAGCASPTTPTTPSSGPTAPGPAGPGPGFGLGDVRYACDDPPGFQPNLLDQPANAELEDHPSAAALRAAIAEVGPDIDLLPPSGYWLVNRDDRIAEYLARDPAGAESDFVSATMENHAGGWRLGGWGGCRPRIVLDGLSPTMWVLDPDVPAPGPDATTFTALVTEVTCTGGQAMGARLQPPRIAYTRDAVLVVFAARPLEGDAFDCPSNPSTRVVVELSEPLGGRPLRDAGVFPPVEPVAPAF